MQLDQGEKGFSFMRDGPLDMRMDPEGDLTAGDIVNSYSEEKLGKIFRELGEEPRWRKAAWAIVKARATGLIMTTKQLATILSTALGRGGRLHPATLVFQALRIFVNQELEAIKEGIKKAFHFLSVEGRIGAISFHSLEDRVIKHMFREACFRPKDKQGVGFLKILTKKPWIASIDEIHQNHRARSAKMRFAQKVVNGDV